MKRWQTIVLPKGRRPEDTTPDNERRVRGVDGLWAPHSLSGDGSRILWRRLLEPRQSETAGRAHPWMPYDLPKTVRPADMEAAVLDALQAIRGDRPNPMRCKGEAVAALKLWRSLGRPALVEWVGEVRLVADAARRCPHGIFANDVRGENRSDGVDRSRSVQTLCAQGRWEERLRVARQWAQGGTNAPVAPIVPEDDLPPARIE